MRRRQRALSSLRWVSLFFIFFAVILVVLELIRFSRERGNFPPGLSIAGIPVAGLDRQQAATRLVQAYGVPVELRYGNAHIQIRPAALGFELDLEGMLAAADLERVGEPFWLGFWDSLWNLPVQPVDIPLLAKISEDRVRRYLADEVASRYDTPPTQAVPDASNAEFQAGSPGMSLNVDQAVTLVIEALKSPEQRIIDLTYDQTTALRPSFQSLKLMLQQILVADGFEGLAEIYLLDLKTRQEIHFAYQSGSEKVPDPVIAFSAESTIKIPIMISVYRRAPFPLSPEMSDLVKRMMDQSENPPADDLMALTMPPGRGPLEVTNDLKALGLQNTFLGALMARPVFMQSLKTPANSRTDVSADPDKYSQTTPLEMGMLLDDIYQCSEYGGGTLIAVFPGEITQEKCREMVDLMSNNKTGVLFEAGFPEGTRYAHKHAWAVADDGVIHTFGDAGIAYTPGGNFIVSAFFNNANGIVFNPMNLIYSHLGQAIYNYFNQVTQ